MWLNGVRRGVMVPSGLVGPLRWAVDLANASVRIDGPKPPPADYAEFIAEHQQKLRREKEEEALRREFDGATRGSEHDDQELPQGTVVYVGRRRGTYQSFEGKWVGANDHTIRFDDGSTETLKLKELSDWRFVRE